jgi:AcrR family transcriptional regulator
MSIGYELAGRTRQKQRTRTALVNAARDLVARGQPPTVEAAAEAASISRTTAYRYFPNQRALLVAAHPELDARSLLPGDASSDPGARLEHVLSAYLRIIAANEVQYRTMLRLSLQEDRSVELPLRTGKAIGWIEDALAPLRARMPAAKLRRLVLAIRSATGIEALVWLTDIAGVNRKQAMQIMRWSGMALLRAALAENRDS